MRVLVDITHPVNVHFFKHLIWQLQAAGHAVLVTSREKDVESGLLDVLGIRHVCISRKGRGLVGMAGELAHRDWRLYRLARRFRPDVMVAAEAGVSIGLVGAVLGVPRVVFEQVDHAPLQQALGLPLASLVCTGTGYPRRHGSRQVRFRGFLAQAYLDPRRFAPDPRPLRSAGVNPDEPYVVLRLVSWSAAHDIGRHGTGQAEVESAVRRLSHYGRVLISSEAPLPRSLAHCLNPVPVAHLHDLLAFARLCLAEGGTVAVEAGILGTPAVCCNTYDFGYLRALASRYELIHLAGSLDEALLVADRLLADPNARAAWHRRAERMFGDTDDVAAFMRRMVEQAAARRRN